MIRLAIEEYNSKIQKEIGERMRENRIENELTAADVGAYFASKSGLGCSAELSVWAGKLSITNKRTCFRMLDETGSFYSVVVLRSTI